MCTNKNLFNQEVLRSLQIIFDDTVDETGKQINLLPLNKTLNISKGFLDRENVLMSFSPQIRQNFVTSRNSQSIKLSISLYHGSLGKIVDS